MSVPGTGDELLKFLAGPFLLGSLYLAGSYYGSSADQVVRKSPEQVYAAFGQLVSSRGEGGSFALEGRNVPYRLDVEKSPIDHMVVRMTMAGSEAGEAEVRFLPQDDGKATLVSVNVHADQAVLRRALAGTSKEKLGYAPDWMLNIAMKDPLREFAGQVEEVGGVYDSASGSSAAPEQLTPEQQRQVDEWRQYEASRPAVDPNAAASGYLASK